MFKAMEVRKLRADKKSFAVIEPLCSQDGMEGGTVDEEDQAQVTEGFDCQTEVLALFFSQWAVERHRVFCIIQGSDVFRAVHEEHEPSWFSKERAEVGEDPQPLSHWDP